MKFLTVIGLVFLLGRAASPKITVNKNVTITITGKPCLIEDCGRIHPIWVEVKYRTATGLDAKLETKQDIKPQTTIPLRGP